MCVLRGSFYCEWLMQEIGKSSIRKDAHFFVVVDLVNVVQFVLGNRAVIVICKKLSCDATSQC